ncbi:AGAP010550-PA-like protein [Anopheles sinensis]|uniref:AGAP010550-PA-like protein n=1 Tax=Anopheles sinensis TaxID=74873 RepID=A0A084VKV3_ANOSI|nr:AGAP010550-PA-like protein [Anopheles sinensis]
MSSEGISSPSTPRAGTTLRVVTVALFRSLLLVFLTIDSQPHFNTLAFDYCAASKNLCQPATARHVVCNGRRFSPACQSHPKLIKMKPEYRKLILDFHNRLRNNLACGYFRRYAEASSMEQLHWDNTLARMAEYNARTCNFAHDECRNTRKYRQVGQNLAINWFHGVNVSVPAAIDKFQRHWFLENGRGRQKLLDRYGEQSMRAGIGHFTQMVHADTRRIGCAMVRFRSVKQGLAVTQYYLVCNYSEGNLYERPVYRKGRRCSKCKYGCANNGTQYRCLCATGTVQPKG